MQKKYQIRLTTPFEKLESKYLPGMKFDDAIRKFRKQTTLLLLPARMENDDEGVVIDLQWDADEDKAPAVREFNSCCGLKCHTHLETNIAKHL